METEAVMLAEGPYPMTERVRVSDERLGKTIARADRMENSQANIGSDMLDLCLDLRDSRAEIERMRQEWENLRGTAMVEAAEVATLKEQLDRQSRTIDMLDDDIRVLRAAREQAEAMVAALRERLRDYMIVGCPDGSRLCKCGVRWLLSNNETHLPACPLADGRQVAAEHDARIRREALEEAANIIDQLVERAVANERRHWSFGRDHESAAMEEARRAKVFSEALIAIRALLPPSPAESPE